MPPRRKKNASKPPARSTPSPSPSSESSPYNEPDMLEPPPPFFNVSFSTHRVSPLYIGDKPLSAQRLGELSRRLRDTLVGDVVRGVQVGLDGSDTTLGRAGSLERVTARWFDVSTLLGDEQGGQDDEGATRPQSHDLGSDSLARGANAASGKRGLCFEMRYENTLCTAILLPALDGSGGRENKTLDGPFRLRDGDGLGIPGSLGAGDPDAAADADPTRFLRLPLLLMRMPTQLKGFITDFIARSFDCRVAKLHLGTRSLVAAWERWVKDAGLPTRGPLAKDLVLTLGFHVPLEDQERKGSHSQEGDAPPSGLGLKSVDIFVPVDDLGLFLRAGEGLGTAGSRNDKKRQFSRGWEDDPRKRSKLAGGGHEEGWSWREAYGSASDARPGTRVGSTPFTDALALYLDRHLGLDIFHPGVRVTRIACGGFALADGRLKMIGFASSDDGDVGGPRAAVRGLVSDLVDRAS